MSADIVVGFDTANYTFQENTDMSSVTISFSVGVIQPLEFFTPAIHFDTFILASSHDALAEGEHMHVHGRIMQHT